MIWNTTGNILFDLLTYGIFLYSVLLFFSYLLIAVFSVGETKRYMEKNSYTDFRVLASSIHAPSISIIAPAYNEGKTIVENVRSLLAIYYTNLEVIVVNDGSKDNCLQQMIDAYDLEKTEFFVDYKIATKEVKGIYKSRNSVYQKLLVVDKVNGGKADALNVGINISSNNYLVCIDVDCILEQDALLKMVKPFLEQTRHKVIASGGVIRIANSCEIEDGRLVKVRLAKDYLPRMQILEYIRAFLLGRMAWSRLNGLLIISGAFGAFDKEIAIKAGGYDHNTVGEDMELIVRMRRYMAERNIKYRVTYIPDPLCWTEAPNSFRILGRQRNRWTRGTIETLKFHKVMFLNPKYGVLGMLSYPYWFFFEMCAPLIEFFGFVCFFVFAASGFLDWEFFFSYLLFIVCFGYLYSGFAIFMEVITFHQYKRRTDILKLMLTALTEPFYFHPFLVWSGIRGYIDYFRKKNSWGEMTRQGFAKKTEPAPIPVPVEIVVDTEQQQVDTPVSVFKKTGAASWLKQLPLICLESFKHYISYALVLLLLMILARTYEIMYDIFQHGIPKFLNKVILLSIVKDLAFLAKISTGGFILFTFLYLLHKKLAYISFTVLSVLFILIEIALSQYFVTSLVPLGADLWDYSIADIKQTVAAAGGIKSSMIIGFFALLAITLSALIHFPKKIKLNTGLAIALLVVLVLATIRDVSSVTNRWMPGQEYSNNLSVNKAYYFFRSSYQHFFPAADQEDIYANNYTGDTFNYIDKQHYPFLHTTDSTADVLSPFFTFSASPPNIVILLVEGLGRAFTNKGAYLGNFTPFIDSLSEKSLYWDNFLSEGGRTFAALPSLLGSLPFAKGGFNALGENMPKHFSVLNLLKNNGYNTSFYYGGDSRFDNMDLYLEKNNIDSIYDEKTFPAGYTKMPSITGSTWGYGDKELFRRYFETKSIPKQPYASVVLTVSTHNPFFINEQEYYLQRFEERMTALGFTETKKQEYRNYKYQYASILFMNDAVRDFITQYQQRPEFSNTVFLITGDHRMPEIPMSTKLDRYHVPLLIYSPLLKRTAKFSSVSTHFDIAPSLTAWLKESYRLQIPATVSWVGSGLDTARKFRNIHAYPLKQTKGDLADFVMGTYMLNGTDLYSISNNMDLSPEQDDSKTDQLTAAFRRFKIKNADFEKTLKLLPDSLLQKYTPH